MISTVGGASVIQHMRVHLFVSWSDLCMEVIGAPV